MQVCPSSLSGRFIHEERAYVTHWIRSWVVPTGTMMGTGQVGIYLTPWNWVVLQKLVKIFSELHGPQSYYRIYKSLSTVHQTLNQSSGQSCFFTTYFNIISLLTFRSSKWSPYFRFLYKCQCENSIYLFSICAPCPAVLIQIWFDHINNIWQAVQIMRSLSIQFLFSALSSNTPTSYYTFRVRDGFTLIQNNRQTCSFIRFVIYGFWEKAEKQHYLSWKVVELKLLLIF